MIPVTHASTVEPSGARSGAIPRLRKQLLVIMVGLFLATLTLFAAGPRADAFVAPPVPVPVLDAVASPAAEVLGGDAIVGCVASVVCGVAVGAAASIAIAAYATHDSWWPAAKSLFGGGQEDPTNGDPKQDDSQGRCSVSVSGATVTTRPSGSGYMAGTGTDWVQISDQSTASEPGGCGEWYGSIQTTLTCQRPDGTTYSYVRGFFPTAWSSDGSGGGTGEVDFAGCVHGDNTGSDTGNDTLLAITYFASATTAAGAFRGFSGYRKWVIPTDSDAEISQTTVVHCLAPDGSTFDITGTVTGGEEIAVPSCQAAEAGSIPLQVTFTGGATGHEAPLGAFNMVDIHSLYPDCFDSSGAFLPGTCVVRVWVNGVQCSKGVTGCADWYDNRTDSSVDCKFGYYSVAMADCTPLRYRYRTDAATTYTISTVDTDGNAAAEPDPADNPTPTPSASASADPSTTADPDPDKATSNPDTASDGSTEGKSCMGGAVSWDPLDWVYVPIKCALKWAFVPDPTAIESQISGLQTAWSASSPGQWVAAIAALAPSSPGAASCQGPSVDLTLLHAGIFYPFQACSGWGQTMAGLCNLVLTVASIMGGALSSVRALGAGLGWTPSIGTPAGPVAS